MMSSPISRISGPVGALLLIAFAAACSDAPVGPDEAGPVDRLEAGVAAAAVCQPTGVGSLTANYVNEVPAGPFTVTCDIGIFFDQDGTIDGAEVNASVADARSRQFGIRIAGANVDVRNSTVTVPDDYPHQFVSLSYVDGATGTAGDNEITGGHRAGILIRGPGTSVTINGNTVRGEGPTASGWANNGIQIDTEASATVTDNLIADHWWNLDNFVSSGLLVLSDDVTAQRNTLVDNDLGVYVVGSRNNLVRNRVEILHEGIDISGIYGILIIGGEDNGVRQSEITSAATPAAGVGLYLSGTTNAKVIRNDVSGWSVNFVDGGDETKLPKPFQIEN